MKTPESLTWSDASEQLFLCVGSVDLYQRPVGHVDDFVCIVTSPVELTKNHAVRSFGDTGIEGYVIHPRLFDRETMEIWEKNLPKSASVRVREPDKVNGNGSGGRDSPPSSVE
jgi:hypothetical protein